MKIEPGIKYNGKEYGLGFKSDSKDINELIKGLKTLYCSAEVKIRELIEKEKENEKVGDSSLQ